MGRFRHQRLGRSGRSATSRDPGILRHRGFAWGTETWTSPERVAGYAEAGGHQIGNAFAEQSAFLWQEALAAETITEDQIAAAAQKALELTFKVGAFEDPYVDESQAVPVQESFEDDAHEAMMKAFTLLRNDDAILPLDENSADQNETAGIQVFFDGFDDTKILDYTWRKLRDSWRSTTSLWRTTPSFA